jgi:general secretion pathway protein K
MNAPHTQRGVALIMAIAIVAVAVSLAAYLAFDQQVAIRSTHNLIARDQASQYVYAAEGLAQIALSEDAADNNTDTLTETWAQPASLPLSEDAEIAGQLSDLQGRLNLNNLVSEDGKVDATALARLERLLGTLELPAGLAAAIVDWIDPDGEPYGPSGAEDGSYTREEPPYLTANTPMVSVSELRLIAGMEQAAYQRLVPFVSVLPETTSININTAPPEVLRAIGVPAEAIDLVLQARDDEPFPSVGALLALPPLKDAEIETAGLDVRSSYFGLRAQSRFAGSIQSTFSLIHRAENGTLRVLSRRQVLF